MANLKYIDNHLIMGGKHSLSVRKQIYKNPNIIGVSHAFTYVKQNQIYRTFSQRKR